MDINKQKKIFIVDDDVLAATALQDHLMQFAPHQISLFETGEDCLSRLSEKPDVVILDYYLDTVKNKAANGMEVLSAIKRHYPDVHVIMLSGQESYGTAMKTIQKGAVQYVIKDKDAFSKIAGMIKNLT